MGEGEPGRVQGRAAQASSAARAARRGALDGARRAAVRGVARHGMADGGQVHADLVRAPGVDAHAQQRRAVEGLHHAVARSAPRARAARARTSSCDARGRGRWARRSRPRAARGTPSTTARYSFSTVARRELRAPARGGSRRPWPPPCRPGGAAVQAVHDARPQHAADAREVAHVMEQRVHQRPRGAARARVHDEPGRLVDHQQVRVLVHDGERDVLGPRARPPRARAPPPRPAGRRAGAREAAAGRAVERAPRPPSISACRRARLRSGSGAASQAVEALAGSPVVHRRGARRRHRRPLRRARAHGGGGDALPRRTAGEGERAPQHHQDAR